MKTWWKRHCERRRLAAQQRRQQLRDGCEKADCACDGCICADDACSGGNLWLSLVAITWYALWHHPHDPHTATPRSIAARAAWQLVRSYQLVVSARRPHPVCPMTPSCSRYALEAFSRHGAARGGVLTARRLRRCSRRYPAYDPVP